VLIAPLGAILGPLLSLGRGQESALPLLLVYPRLAYLGLFGYSLIIWLRTAIHGLKEPAPENQKMGTQIVGEGKGFIQ
jgi:hypothetical protein